MSLVQNPATLKPEVHSHDQFQSMPQTFSKKTEPEKNENPQNKTESPISSAKEPNSNNQNDIKKNSEIENKIEDKDIKPETIGGKYCGII